MRFPINYELNCHTNKHAHTLTTTHTHTHTQTNALSLQSKQVNGGLTQLQSGVTALKASSKAQNIINKMH